MSEIKDNKGVEEVKQNGSNQPDNLCCTCQTGPTTITNESQCKEQCCRPKTIICPDIREAKCIPALIDRIYDYVCLESEQTRCAKDKTFEIIWAGTDNYYDLVGKEVCINTITLQYDCLGIKNENIETEIGLNQTVTLQKDPCSQCSNPKCPQIYTEYNGSIPCSGKGCCENGRTRKVCQSDIIPDSCFLYIIVEGTAGCIPFKAQYLVDNLADNANPGLGFKYVDFFGQVCLPDDRKKVNLRATFDVCVSVPCVAPKGAVKNITAEPVEPVEPSEHDSVMMARVPLYSADYGFDANIFASLLVTEKLYVVVKDEVAVYTTPNTLSCTNGGFTSNCKTE
ncbi:hypothetical protein [Romboutsia ilealis]|uniref:hypothetical protein n=3 Tax=Romboutsia ilealis TaxID=1115758 RepID=UPI00259D2FE3|nr:hypothetical protein [Romboutsia ilealis]